VQEDTSDHKSAAGNSDNDCQQRRRARVVNCYGQCELPFDVGHASVDRQNRAVVLPAQHDEAIHHGCRPIKKHQDSGLCEKRTNHDNRRYSVSVKRPAVSTDENVAHQQSIRSNREMASLPRNVVTTAGSSEIPATTDTVLIEIKNDEIDTTNTSKQDVYAEDSNELLPSDTNDDTSSRKRQQARQENRQHDATMQEVSTSCKSSAEKHLTTVDIQQAKINKRLTVEKVEKEIQQKPGAATSAKKSLVVTSQAVQKSKARQISAKVKKSTGKLRKS